MKLKLLLSAIFFCTYISAQDWSPVKLNETGYYLDQSSTYSENLVSAIRIDSIVDSAGIRICHFNSRPASTYQSGNFKCMYTPYGATWLGKRMIITSAGKYGFIRHSPHFIASSRNPFDATEYLSRDTLWILSNAPIDSSWVICRDITGNKLVGKVLFKTFGTYYGVNDSVQFIKIDRYDKNGNISNDSHFSSDTIILSKKNGFIKSFDFNTLPEVKSAMIIHEHVPLRFKDVYDFNPGDIFHYTNVHPHKIFNDYILAKDTSILDSVTYTIRRIIQTQITTFPFPKEITDDTLTESYKYSEEKIHPNSLPEEPLLYTWFSNIKILTTYHVGLHQERPTETYYDESISNIMHDDSACFDRVFEGDTWRKHYMKGCGYYFTHTYKSGFGAYNSDTKSLFYYKKGNITWGSPNFLGLEHGPLLMSFSVYPNPCHDFLTVTLTDKSDKNIYYKLYCITGQSVSEGLLPETKQLNIKDLNIAPGIYFLNISTEGKSGTIKVSIE